ncbi:MAG: ABC transporter ATP-binding protein [Hyphomicrobium sp.]
MSWFFDRFETHIDPFAGKGDVRPPDKLGPFYWHFIRQSWAVFAALLCMGFIGAVIEASLFAFVGSLVDRMREAKSPENFISDNAHALIFMAIVAAILRPLVSFVHDIIKHQMIGGAFTTLIRWQAHAYVLRQSLSFFQNDFAGRVANKVMQSGPAVRESVVQAIDAVWFVSIYWLTAFALFAKADVRLVGPLLVWFLAYALVLKYFIPKLKERAIQTSEARSMLTGRIVDSYTNILTVKLFAHTEREDRYAQTAMDEQLEKLKIQLRLTTLMETALFSINGFLLVAISALAILLWSMKAVTIGAIALVLGLTIRIVNMSGWVMWTVAGIFENLGIAYESMETISRPWTVTDKPNAKPLTIVRGEIDFKDISFHYGYEKSAEAREFRGVIENFSLKIASGEKVGLVGRSGAGKSTLVSLLMRFYDLDKGQILIDGQDIASATQESLRSQIGFVTQDTSLLHRSVLDNILYGRPDAGIEAAKKSATRAHADTFIPHLMDLYGRKGYSAHVGERGVKLSGGQRQRIAIARVLLKNAPILVLDEATSALDSEVEAAIQESLKELMLGKTVIAIAHRLSTIAAMDRLVVMDHGRIVEEGSHNQLIKIKGLYADLWKRQSGGFLGQVAAA